MVLHAIDESPIVVEPIRKGERDIAQRLPICQRTDGRTDKPRTACLHWQRLAHDDTLAAEQATAWCVPVELPATSHQVDGRVSLGSASRAVFFCPLDDDGTSAVLGFHSACGVLSSRVGRVRRDGG